MHLSLIPQPKQIQCFNEFYRININTVISADNEIAADAALYFQKTIEAATSWHLQIACASSNCICFIEDNSFSDEAYQLEIEESNIKIIAGSRSGFFYGTQTLLQLMPPSVFGMHTRDISEINLPCVTINDKPQYKWRGAMLDLSRHFFPPSFIKKFIDLLAMHKLNVLHLHLTDEHGWRIEIKKYPKLTSIGAYRKETIVGRHDVPDDQKVFNGVPYGGFLTQDEVRDLVRYAGERAITIIPEIDLPGHTRAAIAAYPELGCTGKQVEVKTCWGRGDDILNPNDFTLRFFKDVFIEIMDMFPSPFIHVGGDEVIKEIWRNSPTVQEKMKELGLSNEDQLQSYFIRHFDKFLASHGRRLVGWDEILEGGLAESATVMSWRGEEGGITAANSGHDVVMAPCSHVYFDFYQSEDKENEPMALMGFTPLEKVYAYDPTPSKIDEDKRRHILGAQGQLWTEYIPTPEQLEYMAFPRLCALSEITWTQKEDRHYDGFLNRLRTHLQRLDAIGVHYRKLDK